MSEKCSVTVITLNEERNLRECLRGVSWADEIVVVDSGSTDKTVEISRECGAKVFYNAWIGMREQKNFAADRASNVWILNLDADERVTSEAQEEIRTVLRAPRHAGYEFPRKNIFLGKWMRHGGWYPDRTLRLYRKDLGSFGGINPHSNVIVSSGAVGRLSSPLVHYTYTSFSQYISKQYPYCDAAARELASQGEVRSVSAGRIFTKTAWKFVETFIVKRGFLDGPHGLIVALGATFAAYMKQARLWEITREKAADDLRKTKTAQGWHETTEPREK
jgi:glycosyltransferase involved in cell wall biosynthesis